MLADERGQAVSLTQPIRVEAVAKGSPSASDLTASERMFMLGTLTYGLLFHRPWGLVTYDPLRLV
jgi:hypothetical protein